MTGSRCAMLHRHTLSKRRAEQLWRESLSGRDARDLKRITCPTVR